LETIKPHLPLILRYFGKTDLLKEKTWRGNSPEELAVAHELFLLLMAEVAGAGFATFR